MLECNDSFYPLTLVELSNKKLKSGGKRITYATGIFTPNSQKVNEIVQVTTYDNSEVRDIDDPYVKGGVYTARVDLDSNETEFVYYSPTVFDKIRVWFKLLFEF